MPNLFRVEPPMNPSPSQDNVIANNIIVLYYVLLNNI